MPLILLNRDPKVIPDKLTRSIGLALTQLVAQELSVDDHPDGKLTPFDIEVIVRDVRPEVDVSVSDATLAIIIFANDYPARKANIDERRERIEYRLRVALQAQEGPAICRTIIGQKKAFIWIRLAPGSFGFL